MREKRADEKKKRDWRTLAAILIALSLIGGVAWVKWCWLPGFRYHPQLENGTVIQKDHQAAQSYPNKALQLIPGDSDTVTIPERWTLTVQNGTYSEVWTVSEAVWKQFEIGDPIRRRVK